MEDLEIYSYKQGAWSCDLENKDINDLYEVKGETKIDMIEVKCRDKINMTPYLAVRGQSSEMIDFSSLKHEKEGVKPPDLTISITIGINWERHPKPKSGE